MSQLAINTFDIGLSAWIIQDGNYPEFSVGDRAKFALELDPERLQPCADDEFRLDYQGSATYWIVGRTEFAHPEVRIVNFGFRGCSNSPATEELRAGDWIKGMVYVGVEPYSFFEQWQHLPGMPAITYDWLVRRIQLETTPWIEVSERTFERDKRKVSFREVMSTNSWKDDGGNGHYILTCERIGSPS